MKSVMMRITFSTILLFALTISSAYSATERRTALVIGNSSYSSSPLANPVNDASVMASTLQRLGFDVILKKNAVLQDMEDSIREFGDRLRKGGVGLFFYAGHGVQVAGKNYLIPVGANVSRETDVRYKAVDADMILDEMGSAGNNMNIVILDACRDNPFGRSFRSVNRGLAIVSSAPTGTFISYSTSPGKVAADGSGDNSPYTGFLVKYMITPGLPIEEVFKKVRQDIGKMTKGQQVPWELSSLEGQFYFNQQAATNLSPDTDAMFKERAALERERQELEWQEALDAEREQLAAERRKLETERQKLAILTPPSASGPHEIQRDGRFIAYNNGTVLDTSTNLMWAARDNGANINWKDAKNYCEGYRGGGYSDWRMPTQDELAGLYDVSKNNTPICAEGVNDKIHLTSLITFSCLAGWTSETKETWFITTAALFLFSHGYQNWLIRTNFSGLRALPVRFAK